MISFFRSLVRRCTNIFGYDFVPRKSIVLNSRQLRTFQYIEVLFGIISHKISGDIVECGVGKGRTMLYLSFLSAQENAGRIIHGFDSFEGFPEPTSSDSSARMPKRGEWSGVSPEDIRDLLLVAGISTDFVKNIALTKGYLEDTLKNYSKEPIAFLHIDVDLYQSYKVSLNALYPFVACGGLILFDEYGSDRWPGATKAVDEFVVLTGEKLLKEPISGKFYIIKGA
jgi:hypothetical protein